MKLIWQTKRAAFYFALTVSMLMLIKVQIYDQCFAFDANDDVNHTFVNLLAAQQNIRQGALPGINLYNNFGTPVLGDALTFPFSIQSVTYWFFPPHVAMTVNRAIISFLTIMALIALLGKFLSLRSSILCSLLIFFSPGVFWNLAHHHYQMTLLLFCLILYLQASSAQLTRATYILLLWLSYCIFVLSVSIQLVVLSLPFIVLFLPLKEGFNSFRAWRGNLLALFAAAVATWPHTAVFFENIQQSTRSTWSPYSGLLTNLREQVLGLILPPNEWMHYAINGHFSVVTYFSVAYLAFALTGLAYLAFKGRSSFRLLIFLVVLGVVPTIGGFVLQFYGQHLPLVRSVDSTRVWWYSNIFLTIAVGRLLDASWRGSLPRLFQPLTGFLALVLAVIYFVLPTMVPEFSEMAPLHKIIFWGTVLSLSAMTFSNIPMGRSWGEPVGKWVMSAAIVLAPLPTLIQTMALNKSSCGRGNHYFARSEEATFQPLSLLNAMAPGFRMASDGNPVAGHDLKCIFGGVLGSNARAIVSSQKLMDILVQSKLVHPNDNYSFSPPWQTDILSQLGIRYLLMQKQSNELELEGWALRAKDHHAGRPYFLYENPAKPSLVYLLKEEKLLFLQNYHLVPNGIEIHLPPLETSLDLVAAFYRWPRWQAWIDERPVQPTMNDLGMMQIPLEVGNKHVVFRYQGTRGLDFFFSFLASVIILAFTLAAPRLRKKW